MSETNCKIGKSYKRPAPEFAAPSEAPVGEYFPDAAIYMDIRDRIIKHIEGASEREKAALAKSSTISINSACSIPSFSQRDNR